jgi:ComEC/Rec2-related protein
MWLASDVTALSDDTVLLVRVIDEPRRAKVGALRFDGESVTGSSAFVVRVASIDLPWRNASALNKGDLVWVRGECHALIRPMNPFSFDAHVWRDGVSGECKGRYISRPLTSVRAPAVVIREAIRQKVMTLADYSEGGGLFLSMAFGFQDQLSVELDRAFRDTGLTHLIVVSGYQVTLVYALLVYVTSLFASKLRTRFPIRRAVVPVALGLAVAYVECTGWAESSVRALAAAACVSVQRIDEHSGRYAQRIGVSLLVLELVWPWCFFDLGVQLTFAALAGIGCGGVVGHGGRLAAVLAISLSVWCFTSFLLLVWLGNLSLAGLAANVFLAAPWSFLNCVLGPIALAVWQCGFDPSGRAAALLFWANEALIDVVKGAARIFPAAHVEESIGVRALLALLVLFMALVLTVKAWRHHPLQIKLHWRPSAVRPSPGATDTV